MKHGGAGRDVSFIWSSVELILRVHSIILGTALCKPIYHNTACKCECSSTASIPTMEQPKSLSQAKRKKRCNIERLSRRESQRTLSPLVAIFEFAGVLTLDARSGLISSVYQVVTL